MKTLQSIRETKQYLEMIGINAEIAGCFFHGFTGDVENGLFITHANTLNKLCELIEDFWNCRGEEHGLEPESWAGGFADNH